MNSKIKSWLLLGGIFMIGIVTGSALTIGLGSHFMHPSGPRDMKKHWMEHLTHELKLTADQQAKIEPILAEAASRIQSVHRDEMDQGAQIFKAANEQISALLTPEQKVEMQKMESEREKMFSGHMRPWGPPPPGGPEGMMPPPRDASTNAAP